MLLSSTAVDDVLTILQPGDFYKPAHAAIYSCILSLAAAGEPVDAVTVLACLAERGAIRKVGGGEYLHTLVSVPPSAAAAASYARIVARKARMRRLVEVGVRWQQIGLREDASDDEVDASIADAEKILREMQDPSNDALAFDDLMREWQGWITTKDDIVATPWDELNEYLGGGMRLGKLYVIAGRPGDAKSLTGLNILTHAAENKLPALMFSLELDRKEVSSRILAGGSWSNYGEIFRRSMSKETKDRVFEYMDTHAGMDLSVNDTHEITVEQITADIRARKPKVALVDYCQLIKASRPRDPRHQVIEHISRSLKICAADTNTAIVLISQVNRDPAKSNRMPTMADLREGGIENDADVVIIMYRPPNDDGVIRMSVNKNRDGKNGTIEFVFRGNLARVG